MKRGGINLGLPSPGALRVIFSRAISFKGNLKNHPGDSPGNTATNRESQALNRLHIPFLYALHTLIKLSQSPKCSDLDKLENQPWVFTLGFRESSEDRKQEEQRWIGDSQNRPVEVKRSLSHFLKFSRDSELRGDHHRENGGKAITQTSLERFTRKSGEVKGVGGEKVPWSDQIGSGNGVMEVPIGSHSQKGEIVRKNLEIAVVANGALSGEARVGDDGVIFNSPVDQGKRKVVKQVLSEEPKRDWQGVGTGIELLKTLNITGATLRLEKVASGEANRSLPTASSANGENLKTAGITSYKGDGLAQPATDLVIEAPSQGSPEGSAPLDGEVIGKSRLSPTSRVSKKGESSISGNAPTFRPGWGKRVRGSENKGMKSQEEGKIERVTSIRDGSKGIPDQSSPVRERELKVRRKIEAFQEETRNSPRRNGETLGGSAGSGVSSQLGFSEVPRAGIKIAGENDKGIRFHNEGEGRELGKQPDRSDRDVGVVRPREGAGGPKRGELWPEKGITINATDRKEYYGGVREVEWREEKRGRGLPADPLRRATLPDSNAVLKSEFKDGDRGIFLTPIAFSKVESKAVRLMVGMEEGNRISSSFPGREEIFDYHLLNKETAVSELRDDVKVKGLQSKGMVQRSDPWHRDMPGGRAEMERIKSGLIDSKNGETDRYGAGGVKARGLGSLSINHPRTPQVEMGRIVARKSEPAMTEKVSSQPTIRRESTSFLQHKGEKRPEEAVFPLRHFPKVPLSENDNPGGKMLFLAPHRNNEGSEGGEMDGAANGWVMWSMPGRAISLEETPMEHYGRPSGTHTTWVGGNGGQRLNDQLSPDSLAIEGKNINESYEYLAETMSARPFPASARGDLPPLGYEIITKDQRGSFILLEGNNHLLAQPNRSGGGIDDRRLNGTSQKAEEVSFPISVSSTAARSKEDFGNKVPTDQVNLLLPPAPHSIARAGNSSALYSDRINPTVELIYSRIAETIPPHREGQVLFFISPPQWGELAVMVKLVKGNLRVFIRPDNDRAREEITNGAPQLVELLRQAGFERVEVLIQVKDNLITLGENPNYPEGRSSNPYPAQGPTRGGIKGGLEVHPAGSSDGSSSPLPRLLGYNTFEVTA